MLLDKTDKLTPRPVWERHRRRTLMNINPMPAPTEEEQQDAIRVLEDPDNEAVPGLWIEAHRILDESDMRKFVKQEILNELTRMSEDFPGGYR